MAQLIRTCATLLFAILFGFGCAVHKPRTISLPVTPPDSFAEKDGKTLQWSPELKWWKAFNDPQLNGLMDEAFESNLDIVRAFARLKQSEAVRKTASSAQLPVINAEGKVSRDSLPSFAGDNTGNSYQLSVAAAYELDVWKKLSSRYSAALLDAEASSEDIKALYISLSAQVAELYYLAVEQRAQIALAWQTIASFKDVLGRVELRYREGLVPALDVYQARENLSIAQAQRPVLEENLAVTEHALAVVLGRYPDWKTPVNIAELPSTDRAFPLGIPSDVLAHRPDIRAALLRVRAADERVAAAIADRFPSFNLIGNYGRSGTPFPTGDIRGIFWNLIVSAAQPIMDGGKRRAEIERSEAVVDENLAVYYKTVLTAFQEIEDALAKNRTAEERAEQIKGQVEASSASMRLALERYFQGLSDYMPVLSQQQLLFNSKSALLEAKRRLISARIQLARALGGEWMDKEMAGRFDTVHTGKEETR